LILNLLKIPNSDILINDRVLYGDLLEMLTNNQKLKLLTELKRRVKILS